MVFSSAILLFTIASLLCGFSASLPLFILARIVQGIGGALMVPVGRLIVLRVTPKAELMGATARIVWPRLIAPVLGPPLGGFLTTYLSWPWIFYLNIPLGLVAFVIALKLVPAREHGHAKALDWVGAILSGCACTALAYGLDLIGREGASPIFYLSVIAGGLALGAIRIAHLRRRRDPLIDLSVMRFQTFGFNVAYGSLSRLAIGTAPFLLPLMFQVGMGFGAIRSGFLVLAVFAGNLAMKAVTTQVLRRFGFRAVLAANGILAALSLALCGLLRPETPVAVTLVLLFASGLFRSMQFTSLATIAFADVPRPLMPGANALASTVMQLTMGAGIRGQRPSRRSGARRAAGIDQSRLPGQLTGVSSGFPAKCRSRLSSTSRPIFERVSIVALPTWGCRTTCSISIRA